MRVLAVLAVAAACAVAAPAASPSAGARQRCDVKTPRDTGVDCFSGAYHGTGFLPMEETITFHRVTKAELRASAFWREWLDDARRTRNARPCGNANAVAYVGTFSFYGGGSFVACSQEAPFLFSGYYRTKGRYLVTNDGSYTLLTHGGFSGSANSDNVIELAFSDAQHENTTEAEVVLGPKPRFG